MRYYLLVFDGTNITQSSGYVSRTGTAQWANETYLVNDVIRAENAISNNDTYWMNAINGCVKVVYCTLLSDLGQPGQHNMLSSPGSAQALITQSYNIWLSQSSDQTSLQGDTGWLDFHDEFNYDSSAFYTQPPLSNSTAFFAWFAPSFGVPTTPGVSTISAQYLCQVPERKGWGSLLVSVLVADIVFLQVLWKLLCWIATFMVERGDEQTKYCIGCAKKFQTEDYVMLTPTADAVAMPPAAAATSAKTALLGKATSMEASDDESQYVRQRSIPRKPCQRLRHRSRDVL
jgi:hypothetical protein